jgi:hypothetical protein
VGWRSRYSRLVLRQWTGWLAALLATLVTWALVLLELSDAAYRRWWGAHPLTTDTVSGLLVLLITVLVVNQLLKRRQARERGQAVASQAVIIEAQAARSAGAVSQVLRGQGQRNDAFDEFRTYTLMLLIGAPVLIDDRVARRFLEEAQRLGGVLARAFAAIDGKAGKDAGGGGGGAPAALIDDAMKRLRDAAEPLQRYISPEVRSALERAAQSAQEVE